MFDDDDTDYWATMILLIGIVAIAALMLFGWIEALQQEQLKGIR